jgi:hypothetical protein
MDDLVDAVLVDEEIERVSSIVTECIAHSGTVARL